MNKYLPTFLSMSIYDIDFDTLYAKGKKVILFDLDNTIISYLQNKPTKENKILFDKLKKMGFEVFIFSNSPSKWVTRFILFQIIG